MQHSILHSVSETGVCRAALPRWYYNIISGKCEQFIYGGCGGNENNFGTSDECEGNCTTNTSEEGLYMYYALFIGPVRYRVGQIFPFSVSLLLSNTNIT